MSVTTRTGRDDAARLAQDRLLDEIDQLRHDVERDCSPEAVTEHVRAVQAANRDYRKAVRALLREPRPPQVFRPRIDFTGRRFGSFIVIKWIPSAERGARQASWLARCELCGKTRGLRSERLRNGCMPHCDCRPQPGFIEMTGRRFGRLTVLGRAPNNAHQKAMWLCVCDCGATVEKRGRDLRSGKAGCCHECGRANRVELLQRIQSAGRAQTFVERRDRTLAAGGRPCTRCGAPLRTARPVCRACINRAKAETREET